RIEHAGNALWWRDVLGRLAPMDTVAASDSSLSRVDQMRDRNALLAVEVRNLLSTLDRPVLVVCPGEVATTDQAGWTQLRDQRHSSGAATSNPWTVVVVTSADGFADR